MLRVAAVVSLETDTFNVAIVFSPTLTFTVPEPAFAGVTVNEAFPSASVVEPVTFTMLVAFHPHLLE